MKTTYKPFLLPTLTGIVVTLCVLFVSEWLIEQDLLLHQQQFENQVESRVDYISNKLQQEINSNLIVIEAIESLLLLNHDINGEQFATLTRSMLISRPSIREVQLSPNAEVKHIYPMEGNESIIGLKLREIPGQKEVVERSIKSGEMIMAGPLNLLQGGEGFIARKPLYSRQGTTRRFWGFITLIIDVPNFYKSAGLIAEDNLTQYALRGSDAEGAQGKVFFGNPDIFFNDIISKKIVIPGGSWQFSASLKGLKTPHDHSTMMLSLWGIAAAIAFGLLSGAFTFLWFKLYRQATHDPLSNLLNRQHFQTLAEAEITRAKRYEFSLTVMMIDLDHFKQINDQYGHQEGDTVIKKTAQLINSVVRESDLVGRYGGEEFIVLVPHNGAQRAIQCAERIRSALQRTTLIKGQSINLSASIGLCSLSEDEGTYEKLVNQADRALYHAKAAGRNQVICCDQELENTPIPAEAVVPEA